jgi:cyclopropane fatty-acyl-phospholipid synthase-like methyltransferase
MWFLQRYPQVRWYGSDVDAESIEWCRRNIPSASFTANAPMPPLAYEEGTFDLLYAISVFTHLNEEYQRAWIADFHRMLRPRGLLLLTVHSEQEWSGLSSSREIRRQGLVVHTSGKLKGIMPDWYQTTFQTADHLMKSLSANFTVVQYARGGFGYQDAIVARRD